jgi:hypothetical protein
MSLVGFQNHLLIDVSRDVKCPHARPKARLRLVGTPAIPLAPPCSAQDAKLGNFLTSQVHMRHAVV